MDQLLPAELHLTLWSMQLRTRAAWAAGCQAFMKSPCMDDAMPEARAKPAVVPCTG